MPTQPYDPFRPPGAVHTFAFIPDHPAYRQGTPSQPSVGAVTSKARAIGNSHALTPVLFPFQPAQPPAAAADMIRAFMPPAAKPQQIQCFG